jgi:hypothetical protein
MPIIMLFIALHEGLSLAEIVRTWRMYFVVSSQATAPKPQCILMLTNFTKIVCLSASST